MPKEIGFLTGLSRQKTTYIVLFFCSIFLLFLFKDLIQTDPILNYDDILLLTPLKKIQSLQDYISLYLSKTHIDVQPIRDLSYLIDFKILQSTRLSFFHFSNLIYFLLLIFQILRLSSNFNKNINLLLLLIILFYSFSAVTLNSVAWIAARKHILSALFSITSTNFFFRYIRNKSAKTFLGSLAFYFLSVFSQPISIFLPFFFLAVFIFYRKWKTQDKLYFSLFFILMSLTIFLNIKYYQTSYDLVSYGNAKFQNTLLENIPFTILSIGRYLYQIIIPHFTNPTTHYPGSIQNIIGLIFWFFLVFFVFKFKNLFSKRHFLSIFYFFTLISPVTLSMTNVFNIDTYLLNSSLGIYFFIYFSLQGFKLATLRFFKGLLLVSIVFSFTQNLSYLKIFNDDISLWEFAYKNEATPQSALALVALYNVAGRTSEAKKLLTRLYYWDPHRSLLKFLTAQNIFLDHSLTNEKKIIALDLIPSPPYPSLYYFKTLIYFELKNKLKIQENIKNIFNSPEKFKLEFGVNQEKTVALINQICFQVEYSPGCQKRTDQILSHALFRDWDKEKFQAFRREFQEVQL